MVTAILLIHVAPRRIAEVAARLTEVEGVAEVYSVAGEYDVVAILRTQTFEEIAGVVTGRLAEIDGIERTSTLMGLKQHAAHDLERMFGIGLGGSDER